MIEIWKLMTDGTIPVAIGVLFFLVLAAFQLPKLINGLRGDKADGNVLVRLAVAEAKIMELSDLLHEHAIDRTVSQMHLLKLYHQMVEEGSEIPPDVQEYVNEIMARRAKAWEKK